MTISYAITVHNELEELTRLLDFLNNNIREEDEIIVQYDEDGVTQEVVEYLDIMRNMHEIVVVEFPLNKDFASYKNNLKKHCTKDFIFKIDADEIPTEYLVRWLPKVLEDNPVDIIFVPRVNTVDGLTQQHIDKWRWNVNEKGWVNWPDYQTRIYKNTEDVTWMNKVHEKITGYDTFSNFPAEEHWALYHPKKIDRQEKQNQFYETI